MKQLGFVQLINQTFKGNTVSMELWYDQNTQKYGVYVVTNGQARYLESFDVIGKAVEMIATQVGLLVMVGEFVIDVKELDGLSRLFLIQEGWNLDLKRFVFEGASNADNVVSANH